MPYTFSAIEPPPSLHSVVKNFFVIEFNEDKTQLDYLLPDGLPSFFYLQAPDSVHTYFRTAKREISLNSGLYVGYSDSAVELTHKEMRVVGASLFPMYLSVLFGRDPFEFINKFSPLSGQDHFASNVQSLLETSTYPYTDVVSSFGKFLIGRLNVHDLKSDFYPVYEKLTGAEGYKVNVEDIARSQGYSRRYLHVRFQKLLGMSTKKFVSLVRFNHAVREIYSMSGDKNLSSIAHEMGYHDQSHFIHDFKKICGKTPKELLQNVDSLAAKFQQQ